MTDSKAILYPTCFLRHRTALCASVFFSQVFVLAPSEDSSQLVSSDVADLIDVVPMVRSPLGDKIEEFRNGLKAIKEWGEQIGLGSTINSETLYSALSQTGTQEIQEIISAIKRDSKEDLMMASRVFLKLSQDADRRLDELDREFERIEGKASRLSQLIEGGEDLLPAEGEGVGFIEPLNRAHERLKAWFRIAFSAPPSVQCWPIGESIAVKDIMDSAYESITKGRTPVDIAVFHISERLQRGSGKDIIQIRESFEALLKKVSGEIHVDDIQYLQKDNELISLAEQVQALLANSGPEGGYFGPKAVVTLYPGTRWEHVLARAARLQEEADLSLSPVKGTISGTVFLI